MEECGGCRRSRTSEREHAFEVVLTDGDALQLCAATAQLAQQWLQALCQAVSQGMGVSTGTMSGCVAGHEGEYRHYVRLCRRAWG